MNTVSGMHFPLLVKLKKSLRIPVELTLLSDTNMLILLLGQKIIYKGNYSETLEFISLLQEANQEHHLQTPEKTRFPTLHPPVMAANMIDTMMNAKEDHHYRVGIMDSEIRDMMVTDAGVLQGIEM